MKDTTIIAALPVGELADDFIKRDFEQLISVFRLPETELVVADPVTGEAVRAGISSSIICQEPGPSAMIPLSGPSVQTIEAAVLASSCICLICPVQGGFAPPSSVVTMER